MVSRKIRIKRQTQILAMLSLSIAMTACAPKKPEGFGLADSPIRFQTAKFADAGQLAEVNGMKITSSQILDKSPVIKDLDQQRNEALIAMVYLKAAEKNGNSPKGNVEVFLPESKKPLDQLLARFGRKPVGALTLNYGQTDDKNLVGRSGNTEIKKDELDENNNVLQVIEQRRFNEVASQLNQQLSRILLNEEAIKAKKPLQDYINAEVLHGKKVVVSDQDLSLYLNKIGFAQSELTPELKQQFLSSLAQREEQKEVEAYVAKNILKGPVAVSIRPPSISIRLSDKWKAVAGYSDAPIALIAFAGTTCPDCPDFVTTVKRTMEQYPGYLKLNWIHNFNPDDGVARMMAQAALCFESMKPKSSLNFMADFSQKAAHLDENAFYDWAKKHSIDDKAFKTCFVSQSQDELINQHIQYAKQIGIVANPSLWIEGQMLEGVIRPEEVDRVIDNAIAEKQISPVSAFLRRVFATFRSN